jgi:lipopolysaccharide biosynthesis protein
VLDPRQLPHGERTRSETDWVSEMRARLIAFYLPQFHPIPENDRWWGRGFTEWTNVAKARPLFPGHYQPRIPADLGFYDLRLPEVREAQAEMARTYGIEGFCYYHYWFGNGRRLLERPFNEVLETGKPDFSFCLCWANKTWSGIWKGASDQILMEQTYPGMQDHAEHFRFLLRAFEDDRYVKVDGKPLFIVYHPDELPDVRRVTDFWRESALKAGFKGLYLLGVLHLSGKDLRPLGYDGAVLQRLAPFYRNVYGERSNGAWGPIRKVLRRVPMELTVYSYEDLVTFFVPRSRPNFDAYPCVIPNWDNTPRSGVRGLVFHESDPELFRRNVRDALRFVEDRKDEYRLVFLKSWNEWAEGNYMEPDLRYGHGYLEALRDELGIFQPGGGAS